MHRFMIRSVASLALVTSALASNTWYVDVNGTAPGTGTQADPYTSIQYAVTRPTTGLGDTILVAPGTYVENVRVTQFPLKIRSTAGPAHTFIKPAVPGSTVFLDAGMTPALDGFTVFPPFAGLPSGGAVAAILLYDSAVTRCIVRSIPGYTGTGIFVNGFGRVTDCTITGNGIGINLDNFIGSLDLSDSIVTGNFHDLSITGAASAGIAYTAGIETVNLGAQGWTNIHMGPGNLTGDVGFWNSAKADFHLRPGSQCIDAGNPALPLDPDGSRHDIGALSYDSTYAPEPTRYCAGKLNSGGCVPEIGAIGSASASLPAPFWITATNEIPGKSGLLFFGFGERAQPFQGGLHCITLPTKRVGVQLAGGAGSCGGTYQFDMGGYIQSGAHPGLVPGSLVYSQWWSRDPLDPQGFGTGLSDAICFGIAP